MSKEIKAITADYIESGTFQGSEEEVSMIGIRPGDEVVIMKRADFDNVSKLFSAFSNDKFEDTRGKASVI